jgi:hypothetical protein
VSEHIYCHDIGPITNCPDPPVGNVRQQGTTGDWDTYPATACKERLADVAEDLVDGNDDAVVEMRRIKTCTT